MPTPKEISDIRALLITIQDNLNLLDVSLRNQLLPNADQVFHVKVSIEIPDEAIKNAVEDFVQTLKTRQETLVSETIRRVSGRSKSMSGSIREALNKLDKSFS